MGDVKNFMDSRTANPTPGKWCAGFSACKNYAIQNNIPLITAYISTDLCHFCNTFARVSTSKEFTDWMKTTGYIFWLGCEYCQGEDGEYGAGYKWCYGIAGSGGHYPGCRIYWESNGKVNVNTYRNGDILAIDADVPQTQTNIDIFSKLLKDFQPTPPEPPKYSITFNPNGGTLMSGMTRTVTENTAIGELPIPVRSGWTFNGWFTAASGGTQINAATVITANATYYAHWTETPITPPTPDPPSTDPGQPQPPPTPGQPLKTMFGLCRDCTIITKDNKILQYSAAAQKIMLVGDYNPNEFLAVSKKIT